MGDPRSYRNGHGAVMRHSKITDEEFNEWSRKFLEESKRESERCDRFEKMMAIIAIAAFLFFVTLMIFFPRHARADVGVELQGGISQYDAPPCGLWQFPCFGYPTENHMKSLYVRAGTFIAIRPKLEGHVFAYSLGKYSTDAVAPDDEGCAYENQGGSPNICGGTARYKTFGSVAGLGASLRDYFGPVFAEAGATFNRQTFKLNVSEKQSGRPDFEYEENTYGVGTVIGGGIQFRNTLLAAYRYSSGADGKFYHHQYEAGVGKAYVLAVGYRF